MPNNRRPEDEFFDDIETEEALKEEREQAELDAAETEVDSTADSNDPAQILSVLDKLKSENEEMKDRTLRTIAEMDNLRKRTAREITDARSYAVANFARDLLGVGDNLQRAIQAVPVEKRESGSEEFKALIEGVELTERELLKALTNAGVNKFNPEGEKFDPNFHQAMFELPDPNVPNNSVAQVVQEGYKIGDRVLRPAMVGVAKGGPKFEDVVNPDQDSAEEADTIDE
ncbi:MAG: nucleotide exchange factor GrpE [Rhizobiaceae bacterium]|nr:nucleotide exchange factor GrpE [Rhizobiaceae bacterium]